MPTKVGFVSLGCPKNLVDSEVMLGILKDSGFEITSKEENADVLIVNTCGFIEPAKEESIRHILELAKYKEAGKCKVLVVAGCLAQRYSSELLEEMPEIDALVGPEHVQEISDIVNKALGQERISHISEPQFIYNEHLPRLLSTPHYTAYVKVAEGCDNRCAYCAIPDIRGKFRSRPIESIEVEVKNLVAKGVKEVILIAQDTTRYGLDLYGKYSLDILLNRLGKVTGLRWIRIMYCYPNRFTNELIDIIAETPTICKYIDLPIQHASDKILSAMGRPVNQEQIRSLVKDLRKKIPGVVLRTSFIVGFPGESENDFQELLAFMKEMKFDRAGVFTYSQEEGTPAATMTDQISDDVKQERYHRAMSLQKDIALAHNQARIGQVLEVLVEELVEGSRNIYIGRSSLDAPEIDGTVEFSSPRELSVGDIVKVTINRALEYDLMGELAQ
ncbi:30S ribosomal protein S12 methylthiotransferase RimO [Desulforamulus aquiferis]|uniref:Ribosomal protein uS12 methylthiotransferase RimO n=1 Tax=Desulforamulus aquiferis TaxID=1397668 RepID=A0AAW7ZCP3_9FIRM|nr:30S ribosomal protein S12 methylthiotransferase RimO [Desulforamulus aquiferis]MDO7787457.1 30S ribosomal protein S12 methylthiotransferase RimO [Desulforamulus aquiferis]